MDVVVYFFILGLVARLGKSDLKLPSALYDTLSVILLLTIGLKGGMELHSQPVSKVLPQVLLCAALGAVIPLLVAPVLRRVGLSGVDAAAMAAHYGSVSVVTFAVAQAFLQQRGVSVEAHAALWVAVMEAPGIVVGIVLARRALRNDGHEQSASNWKELAHEVLFGKSVLLLVGGLAIGAWVGERGLSPIAPLFFTLFKGALALFLLELGLVAGDRIGDIKRYGMRLVAVGVLIPMVLSLLGLGGGKLLGLGLGGCVILATLAASASYIAAPTALRMAVPQANAVLSIAAALGITFPFNIVLGIPLYLWVAKLTF